MIKGLKHIEPVIAFLAFLLFLIIPQINVSEYVKATITSKFIYFIYSCLVLFGSYMLTVLVSKKVVFVISKLDIALLLLIVYITLNRYIIQPQFGFSIRYMELLGLSVLYGVLRSFSLKYCLWLLLAIVISGIIQAVYGNLQLLGYCASNHSGFKMTGSFFNPGPYAGFLASVWPIALGMYLFKEKIITQLQSQTKNDFALLYMFKKRAFEYIPLMGLTNIAIVLPATQSRASWIAAIVGSVILMELRFRFMSNLFKKATARLQKTTLVILLVGILSAGFFSIYHYKKASSEGRAFIWKVTTEIIVDQPVFGVGFDRFKANYMNYQANYFAENGETQETMVADNTYYAFNEGLQFVTENGLLGSLFFIIAILVLFKIDVKEKDKRLSLIAKTGLLTIGVFSCFSYPAQILPVKLVMIFLLAILSNSYPEPYQLKNGEDKKKRWAFKTIVLLLGGFGMYQTSAYVRSLDSGFIVWGYAIRSYQYGDYNNALNEYASIYPVFKKNGDFLMNYGKALSMAGEHYKAIDILEQAKPYLNTTVIETGLGDSYKAIQKYDKAEAAYQQGVNMIPSKFYINYLLAKLYDDSGQVDKAVLIARKLMVKEVKIPSAAIKEIHVEMRNILRKHEKPEVLKIKKI